MSFFYKGLISLIRELAFDDAVGFREMPTAHARKGTYQRRVKVDDISDSNHCRHNFQEVRLFFDVFSR